MSRMALSSWCISVCGAVCAVTGAVCQESPLAYLDLTRPPDAAWTVSGGVTNALAEVAPRVWSNAVARVEVPSAAEGSRVRVSAPGAAIEFVGLRWSGAVPASAKLLGDTWERSYGDLAWRPLAAARPMPWYFLASDGRVTHG